jgi:hypothetical protein
MDWDDLDITLFHVLLWLLGSFLVGCAARYFKRSGLVWGFLSIVFSPVAGIVFLLVAGLPHGAVLREEAEGSVRDRHGDVGEDEVEEMAEFEGKCPYCEAPVNIMTGEGLESDEEESWVQRCAACGEVMPPEALRM